jgi:hypothetical protein
MLVPQQPTLSTLSRVIAGAPATARNHTRWNDDLAFLNSYAGHPTISVVLKSILAPAHFYQIAYTKTPGIKAIRITLEPHVAGGVSVRSSLKVTVTASGGTINWIETGTGFFHDGSYDIPCQSVYTRDYPEYSAHLDVSALADDNTYDLKFDVQDTSVTSGATRSLYKISITEIPLANTDPVGAPTTENGVNPAWLVCTERNRIVDGDDTTTSYGTQRLANQLEIARFQKRRQIQFVSPEDTTDGWNVTASAGAPGTATTLFPFGYPVTIRMRARALYGTTVANTYLARIRYVNSGANKLKFRIAVQPVGGAITNYNWLLPNTATFAATILDDAAAPLVFSIPCTGTDQECDLTFYADNNAAGTTHVSQFCALEAS